MAAKCLAEFAVSPKDDDAYDDLLKCVAGAVAVGAVMLDACSSQDSVEPSFALVVSR